MCVPAFSFSPMVTNHFFSSFLLHSLHLPHLFSLHPLILSNSSIFSFSLFLSSSSPMAPKAKKSFYVLFADAFHLTRWIGTTRLVGPPPLTYRLENHIPMGEFVSFSFFFSHFQVPLWSLVWMCFWLSKCLGFAVGWVKMETWCLRRGRNVSRMDFGWCFLENVEKLLLSVFVRGLGLAYTACIHAYAALFLHT